MGALVRWATLIALLVFALMLFTERNAPTSGGGIRGAWERVKFIGRKARLVALIYIAVIVLSAIARVAFGWGIE